MSLQEERLGVLLTGVSFFFIICKFLYKINPSGLMICVCVCLCPCLLPPRPACKQTHSHGFTLAFLHTVCWVFNGRVKQQQMAISHCQQNPSSGPDRHVEFKLHAGRLLRAPVKPTCDHVQYMKKALATQGGVNAVRTEMAALRLTLK